MDFLLLASNLALLTYIIGVLILTLPIPYKGLKKWGIFLIIDAISTMVLISIYGILLYLSDYILNLIGYSWSSFLNWLVARTAVLLTLFGALSYISSLFKGIHAFVISSPINIAITYVSLALSALKIIYFLALTIYSLKNKLMLLGIVLYSLPFRIGKGVGAFLIASSIIMYVGFPLLPAFTAYLTPSIGQSLGSSFINSTKVVIVDEMGNRIPYPILLVYTKANEDEPKGVILGNRDGVIYLGYSKDLIPTNITLFFKVEFMGYLFVPRPHEVNTSEIGSRLLLKTPFLLYGNGLSIILGNDVIVKGMANYGDILIINLYTQSVGAQIKLVRYSNVGIDYITINDVNVVCNWSMFTWRNIKLYECTLPLNKSSNSLTIVFKSIYEPLRPKVIEKRFIALSDLTKLFYSYIVMGVTYLYTLVFLPSVYIAFLTSMSVALSRVLGGGIKIKLI